MIHTPNPTEAQIERAARAFFREYHGEDIWPELRDDGELDTRSRALAATRVALTAAGVAPQEPNQNETKSGSNFVSLDPEKVAEVLMRHEFNALGQCTCGYATPDYGSGNRLRIEEKRHFAHALCEAYTEERLT